MARRNLILICDGGLLGNGTENNGYGSWRVEDAHAGLLFTSTKQFGKGVTNNEAEYRALYEGMRSIIHMYPKSMIELEVRTDSALLIGQLTKGWACNHEHLQVWIDDVKNLIEAFSKVVMTKISGVDMKKILGH